MKLLLVASIVGIALPVFAGDGPGVHREYPIDGIAPAEIGQAVSAAHQHFAKGARVISVSVDKGSIVVATVYVDASGQEIGESVFVSRTESGWPLQKRMSPIHVGGLVAFEIDILSEFIGQLPRDYQCLSIGFWKPKQIVVRTGSYRSGSDYGGMTYVYEREDEEWCLVLKREWGS